MPKSSAEQSSFLGGEWGPLSQGRHDDPRYSTALALSLNGYPVEEGAWTERGGTQFCVPTAAGRTFANLLSFEGSETCSFAMEFTNDTLRLLTQTGVVCTNDAQTITGTIPQSGTLFISGQPSWSVGDLFQLVFPDVSSSLYPYPQSFEAGLRSQVFKIGGLTNDTQSQGSAIFTANPANGDTLTINSDPITFSTAAPVGNQTVQIGATVQATYANLRTWLIQNATYAYGTVTFSGNPANNDTLTIDGTLITFVTGAPSGSQVQIASTLAGTLANLLALCNAGGGNLGLMTYAIDPTNTILQITSVAKSTTGNAYTLAASSTVITLSGSTLLGGYSVTGLGPATLFFSGDATGVTLVITYQTAGTGGNSVGLTTTSAVITVSGATLSGGNTTGSTLTFTDDLGNAVPTTSWVFGAQLVGAQILHHKLIVTPYSTPPVLAGLRAVQAEVNSIVLSSTQPPYELQITTQGTLNADPVFAWSKLTMVDGPYLDPQVQTLTVSAATGTANLVAGSAVFASTDVGRSIRIFVQPPVYNPASTYSAGNQVTDSTGAWWQATGAVNAGTYPGSTQLNSGVATLVWAPAPTAGSWGWGLIGTVTNSTHATIVWDTTIPNMVINAFGMSPITATEWQLGVYSGTTGYPTCGVFYEGRLWLAGCVPNRFDTTTSNGISQIIGTNTATFSPTDPYGNVVDSSGLSLTLNSSGINQIQWMIGDIDGVLMGTLHGETVVGASVLGDPITPTSVQAHEHTRYGSTSGVDAIRAGMAVIFPQRSQRRIMEYLADAFSGKPTGRHLNEHAKHLSMTGVAKLVYVEEPVPVIYALMNNGLLVGCTYRRFSRFVQTPPEAAGWHWNVHGGGRIFTSMCTVPSGNGLFERLFTVTNVSADNGGVGNTNYFIEIMQPMLDPGQPVTQDWFLDQVGGLGPGNSGFDCGGGNPSSFTQTGFFKGADSSSNVPADNFSGFVPGQSPPWGGVNLLGAKKTVFFPGSVALYNLPKYGSSKGPPSVSPIDEQSLSMSVWVGSGDFPLASGMLFSSPSLSFAQASAATNIVSGLLGWSSANYGSGATALAMTQWGQGYPGPAELDATFSSNLSWTHVMISAKTDLAGNMVVTAYTNETQVFLNQSQGTVGNNDKMWPFNSIQDNTADNGLNVWAIGGQMVQRPAYTLTIKETNQPFSTQPLTVAQIIAADKGFLTGYPVPLYGGQPTFALSKKLMAGRIISNIIAQVTGSGGPSNIPYKTSLGALTGYIGSVAEMWVKPGTFIDWSIAANRNKFHEHDPLTQTFGPIPLGTNGTLPGFGAPLLYLSGGPRQFIVNRATGTILNEIDTAGSPIDFDAGVTGGLKVSSLSFP